MDNTQLTFQDIAAAVQVIDIASTRGAFRGDELLQVGTLRERFATILKDAQESQSAEVTQADQPDTAED